MVTFHVPFHKYPCVSFYFFIHLFIWQILTKPTVWPAPYQVRKIETGIRHSILEAHTLFTCGLRRLRHSKFEHLDKGNKLGRYDQSLIKDCLTYRTCYHSEFSHEASLGTLWQKGWGRFFLIPPGMCLAPTTGMVPWSRVTDQPDDHISLPSSKPHL